MPIPKFDELFNDVLEFLSDRKEYKTRNLKEELSKKLDLTDEERHELLPSGSEPIINNLLVGL
ncbi:winged helix-turn-helix domain-containing protein [Methanobrevibacter sp.]|uniref:winged helix-turn-helix domain-containing protein n=1 Tax=Methanobrevibacter sp. TaxID=66852 RepID=UPI00388F21CF